MGPPRYSHDEPLAIPLRTEDDLVQAAQSGDHEAFVELCRQHAQTARQRILLLSVTNGMVRMIVSRVRTPSVIAAEIDPGPTVSGKG
jgi:hypothetical protein